MRSCSVAILICAVIVAAPGCSRNPASFTSIEQLSDSEIPQKFLNNPSVVLLDDERVEISGKHAIHERKLVKKILQSGHPEEGVFVFSTNKYRKILEIEGRALYPDGREKIILSDDIIAVPDFAEFILYSDQRSLSFRFPGLVAGTIIEVYIKRKIDNLVYWEPALFKREILILTRRYTLIHPNDLNFTVHASLMPETPDSKTILPGGEVRLVWEQHNIEPLKKESMMPSGIEYLPALWFYIHGDAELGAPLKLHSWSGVAAWYREIARQSITPGPGLHLLADTLSAAGLSEREIAKRIFRWVQENIRYVAIYLGDDGFRPHRTDEILANRYGDCKDMSVVLASALREVGIEAFLVLVRTKDLGRVPGAFPSPCRFNHLIAMAVVDGDIVYLDPTCETCSFGILPKGDQGAEALVIRDGENGLIILPSNMPKPNRWDVSVETDIGSDGNTDMTITMEFDGYFAAAARRELRYRRGKSRPEAVTAMLGDIIPALRIENLIIESEDPASDIMTITVEGTIAEMIDMENPYSFLQVVFNPLAFDLPDCRNRFYPIALGTPCALGYEIAIALPDQWNVKEAPPSGNISNNYFDYCYSWDTDARRVSFSRNWSNASQIIPATDCTDIRNLLESINDIEATRILVERK